MSNKINNVSDAIINLKEILELHNDSEIAEKLSVARNTISGMKKRNSSGALFEKICELKENSLSLDAIFIAKSNDEIEYYTLCVELLRLLSGNKQKIDEVKKNLKDLINKEKTFSELFVIIQSIKGKDFFSKFLESWNGKGERMLVILYLFLQDLSNKEINFKDIKEDFIMSLNEFKIPNKSLNSFIFTEKDKDNLIVWVKSNLDDVSCFEIINSIPMILTIIKENLNILNKYTLN
jgi:hypothetical protein